MKYVTADLPPETPGRSLSAITVGKAAVRLILAAFVGFAVPAVMVSVHAAEPSGTAIPQDAPIMGMWLSEKHDGIFRIAPCGDSVCGTLIGLSYGPKEPMPRAKDGRAECDLVMLTGFRPMEDDPGRWEGKILDPDAGNLYHAQIWSPKPDILKLRGYILVPVFGETQTWSRYHGTIGPECRMPANP
ncbi:MAG: DUF2147 domain-containing protein [Acetobacter sp.]|uniref:DUF2147 domain-containing protein n=1 Tax=unclassified Acetobacter TaxID=2628570 RepID=UPI0025BA4C52|nr:DUF2147 domain-containing protein [Acetobacter sp. UBA5411]